MASSSSNGDLRADHDPVPVAGMVAKRRPDTEN